MADDQDDSQKTEEPTQKRLEEAFKRGQIPFSREMSNLFMLVSLTFIIISLAPGMMTKTLDYYSHFVTDPQDIDLSGNNAVDVFIEVAMNGATVLLFPVLATIVAALAASLVQNGIVISGESLKPKLEKISPLKGLKRLFSMKSLMEFFKGIIKLVLVGAVAYSAVTPMLPQLELLPTYEMMDILSFLGIVLMRMMIGVCSIMALLALLDLIYQRYDHKKKLRMSKQEIKDEHKQQEGDPHIKGKLRAIRMERAQRRMMAAIPDADVVITNPTHFAVALKYDEERMNAPFVTAKGQDNIALKMREVAEEHDVPIVENPPLARALFSSAEIDQEIPLDHYQAVAEVISYIYRMKGKS